MNGTHDPLNDDIADLMAAEILRDPVYVTRHIKRRATRDDMRERADALVAILAEMQPMTVRQVFYQASVRGVVDKSEAGYAAVQRCLVDLRRAGTIPWGHIADNTRWQRKPKSWNSPADALIETAAFYRKALWAEVDHTVEVWLEKDALSSVVFPETAAYDVPLMITRGYSSLSFLHAAANDIQEDGRPAYIYHLGDHDPSGVDAANNIERRLREFAPQSEIHFERLAVLPHQIEEWNLPTRPTKTTDTRSKGFGPVSVELDAIDPHRLRELVRETIKSHLPTRALRTLLVAQESERDLITAWAEAVNA